MITCCNRITSYYGCTAGYIREVYNMRVNTKKNHKNVYCRRKNYDDHRQWTESGKSETILLPYPGRLLTEDCRSSHDIRRRIALGKEAFNKKGDVMRGSLSLHHEETYGESICLECFVVWKRNVDSTKKIFGDFRHLKYGYGGE